MKKSILEIVDCENNINPHYDIKAESSSCYPYSRSFTKMGISEI